ncbi:hypothetical protein [Deinococcus multiflagellatus]|uniref:Zinc ribbon domain-containing protein n=1 Tax=Deinococcus multiflagellatus TaxID=1656887 RepID=A0ABW1ZEV4_9DEIO|nr:hypothetical protein [Deinococcus multiflagellatus]MBZ9712224.1 hypothetical protein [Deinococcus multiflagellatus]
MKALILGLTVSGGALLFLYSLGRISGRHLPTAPGAGQCWTCGEGCAVGTLVCPSCGKAL